MPEDKSKEHPINFKLGKLECKTSSFWIAIAFLMAFTVCFITYCICNTVTHITEPIQVIAGTEHKKTKK